MTLPFSLTNESLTIFTAGVPATFHQGTTQYRLIREAILKDDWASVPALLTMAGALQKYLGADFTLVGNKIHYGGVALPAALMGRIQAMADEGLDPSPLLRFYERLHRNPSYRSRNQVFEFLQHLNISIESDGTFLAYKGVREDYLDCHSGTISNHPGLQVAMPRNQISDDPETPCYEGLHVGALDYARDFARGAVVICRVDPEHVVCVPHDCSSQKMRVCQYEVVGEWSGESMDLNADDEDLPIDWDPYLEDGDEVAPTAEPPAPLVLTPQVQIKKTPTPKLDTLGSKDLMLCSIEDLRKYASGMLKIVGASKIPGGKSALVSRIMKIRKRGR